MAAIFAVLILLAILSPQTLLSAYMSAQVYVRIFDIICLSYISIHALKSHMEQPDPTTLIIPLGYVLLGVGQYSVLIWAVDQSIFAFFGGLACRLIGLTAFLYVSYRTFYGSEKRGNK